MINREEETKIVHSESLFTRILNIGLTLIISGTCILALIAVLKVYGEL